MGLEIARLTLNRASTSQQYKDFGIKFQRETITTIKGGTTEMVLLRTVKGLLPEGKDVGPEPRFNLILCGLSVRTADGTEAQGSGQLLITGQRLIGMIEDGKATGGPALSLATTGNVFCFAFHRDDVHAPTIKKHRLSPSEYSVLSKEGQATAFRVTIFSAMAYVANGKAAYWHDKNTNHAFSSEGPRRITEDDVDQLRESI